MSDYRELLLGCGFRRDKIIQPPGHNAWTNLVTLDSNPRCNPDIVHWLCSSPLPFDDSTIDEIHAYEVLEHLADQGDYQSFFWEFGDYWRVLKPNGLFCASVPDHRGIWAWGDPGHRRVINLGTLAFLSHAHYEQQLGQSPSSDYRKLLGDTNFEMVFNQVRGESLYFTLRAIKP